MIGPLASPWIRRRRAIADAQCAYTFELARGVPRQGALRAKLEAQRDTRELDALRSRATPSKS